jgi:hypothetical protein
MEFMSRGSLTQQPQRMATPEAPEMRGEQHSRRRPKEDMLTLGSKIGTGILLVIIVLLVALVAWFTVFSTPSSQSGYVDGSKLQAVFLNTGQVYFGNIKSLNQNYFVLNNVYYLQSSGSSTSDGDQQQPGDILGKPPGRGSGRQGCRTVRPAEPERPEV